MLKNIVVRQKKRNIVAIALALVIVAISFTYALHDNQNKIQSSNIKKRGPISTTSSTAKLQPIEDTKYTKSDAIKTLGLTQEEAQKSKFYVLTLQNPSTSSKIDISQMAQVTIPVNTTFSWAPFTFYEENGGSYWTVQANKIKWGVFSFHGTYDSDYDLRLGVYLYSYGVSSDISHAWMQNGNTYLSDWIPVTWGHDYRFHYYCEYLTHGGYGTATVQMYVVTSY